MVVQWFSRKHNVFETPVLQFNIISHLAIMDSQSRRSPPFLTAKLGPNLPSGDSCPACQEQGVQYFGSILYMTQSTRAALAATCNRGDGRHMKNVLKVRWRDTNVYFS